MSLRRFIPLRP